ncbi:MAG: Rieske (2Fe-2S) protein [Nitrospirae bacterium]|nr:Rieske (2Fe-2S) protein [Nitrospirota bacterium]
MSPEIPPSHKAPDQDPPTPADLEVEVDATEIVSDAVGIRSDEEIGRRRFFKRLIGLIAGVVALGWAVPLAIYGIRPALLRRSPEWTDAGPLDQLGVNQPRELDVVVSRRDGWRQINAVKSFWAYRTSEGHVVAYASACPHLGCAYQWREGQSRFACPCHLSIFSLDGAVLGGPAPRPLDTLQVRVDGGRLFVLPEEFKAGISKKTPL